jgi:hypothetical protein
MMKTGKKIKIAFIIAILFCWTFYQGMEYGDLFVRILYFLVGLSSLFFLAVIIPRSHLVATKGYKKLECISAIMFIFIAALITVCWICGAFICVFCLAPIEISFFPTWPIFLYFYLLAMSFVGIYGTRDFYRAREGCRTIINGIDYLPGTPIKFKMFDNSKVIIEC